MVFHLIEHEMNHWWGPKVPSASDQERIKLPWHILCQLCVISRAIYFLDLFNGECSSALSDCRNVGGAIRQSLIDNRSSIRKNGGDEPRTVLILNTLRIWMVRFVVSSSNVVFAVMREVTTSSKLVVGVCSIRICNRQKSKAIKVYSSVHECAVFVEF